MDSRSHAAVTSTDPRVQAALQDYLGRIDRGERIEVEAFVAQHADVADKLRSFIAFDEEARRLAGVATPKSDPPHADAVVIEPPRSKAEVSTHSVVGKFVETVKPTPGNQAPKGEAAAESIPRRSVVAPSPKSLPPRSPNDLPEKFGRCQVKQKLGEGAMGAVYLAEDTLLQRKVALKTPTFDDDTDGELLKRFYREARAVSKLKHNNLCGVYDVGEIDGRHYISMEFVPGKKLQEFIKPDKPMTEKQAMAVVRKIALAMQEAHTHGVIHRDLKPDNIMVNEKGEPVVMDFGLVHKTEPQNSTKITQRGTLIGSPAYMSKEQVEGDPDTLTVATDQYSLGVILYQLLTSKLPFEGGLHAVLGAILTREPPPPSEHRPELNPHLEVVCLKMMAKEAWNRYPSMKAAADALAEVAKGTSKAAGSIVAPAPIARSLTDGITATFAGVAVPREQTKFPAPNTAPTNSSPFRRFIAKQPMSVQYGSLAAGLVLLWAVVLWFRSGDALVKVTIDSDDVEVTFQDQTIKLKDGSHEYKIKPGNHILHIKSGNIEFDTEKFTLNKGENPAVTVELVESEVVAKLGTRKLTVSISGESSATGKLVKGAPADVVPFEKKLFKVFPEQLTWQEAKKKCEAMGGRLAQIHSQAENDFLMKLATERKLSAIWLGATDEVQERTWLWNNGAGLAFNNFGSGQPDRAVAGKRYLVMMLNGQVGCWCNQPSKSDDWSPGFVCEWNAPTAASKPAIQSPPVADSQAWTELFNGRDLTGWVKADNRLPAAWKAANGYMEVVPGAGPIMTAKTFPLDFQLHVEFWIPKEANKSGQARSNSGIFLLGRHEIQILDAFENPLPQPAIKSLGALFNSVEPQGVTIRPPETWQTFDITFHAPRIDAVAKRNEPGRLTVVHEGKIIIDNAAVTENFSPRSLNTNYGQPGPIGLQDHGSPVRFRNIRIRELSSDPNPQSKRDATVLGGRWTTTADELIQRDTSRAFPVILFGDPTWKDYDFSVDAMRTDGNDQFSLYFRADGANNLYWYGLAEWGNTLAQLGSKPKDKVLHKQKLSLQNGRWYTARVRVRGNQIEVHLSEGQKVLHSFTLNDNRHPRGQVGLRTCCSAFRFRNIKVTAPDGKTLWEGLPDLPGQPRSSLPPVVAVPKIPADTLGAPANVTAAAEEGIGLLSTPTTKPEPTATAVPAEPPQIPPDAIAFQKKRFKLFTEQLAWHDAKKKCRQMGGRLAEVRSKEENKFITTLVRGSQSDGIWLGATDEAKFGDWVWSDGSTISYKNWAANQPNNFGGAEHYVMLLVRDNTGQWWDQPNISGLGLPTNWKTGYICEWDDIAKLPSNEFTTTKSGLRYKLLRDAGGRKPSAKSEVKVNYKGWLDSGKVFDNTYELGVTTTFPLDSVIKGWAEGMQLIGEGGMIELEVPSDLGYGDQGTQGIPGKSTLHFLVELIDVK